MTPLEIGIAGILVMFILMLIRMQIGIAMAVVGFTGFAILTSPGAAFSMLGLSAYQTAASYALTVIPLFLLMAQFAGQSGMGFDLYQSLYRWVGSLPGGLAMATVCACAGFAAISGSSLATAATLGMVALPEMKRYRYDDALATGCVAAGGTLGILIPPSTVMVIYGILTEQSIGSLFIAGIIPGIVLMALFIITIMAMTIRNPALAPPGRSFSMKEKLASLRGTAGIVITFFLVIGGLYLGWFTPTEAAAAGAFIVFIIIVLKRRATMTNIIASLKETALTSAMVFTILIGANIFNYFMTVSGLPASFSEYVAALGMNRHLVMILICVLYIILGCLMEGLAIMFLTIPIIYPLVVGMGFDPIWFGVLITVLIEMGLITPPVGINVFVISGIAGDVPMSTVFRGIFPFFVAMLLCLILLLIFPNLALFLPSTMSG
jgi:C4-dicarboxylate transporter, DctM subunit